MGLKPSLENPIPQEPLTRREREILSYLEKNLTNPEIAEALNLAENSVKGYAQHIYSKLGVNGRREAVQRAREIGLLDSPGTAPISITSPAGRALPVGTVTFLFSDIEGSTPLWDSQPERMVEALQIHNTVLRQAIETNAGVVFKTIGDAFQASFATAPQALKAAIEGQKALHSASWNELGPLKVRMGLHTGEAQLDPGGDEYAVSHTKNRAARIMSAAWGGQILLSQETADLVRRALPGGVTLLDLGEHRLKGIALPERLYQVDAPGLPGEFPSLATAISHPNNLPIQLTSFVGREHEIEAVYDLLKNHRLVTLTGSGGTGKTRLSLQVAGLVLGNYPHGAWFVELAPLTDPARLPQVVAAVLGLQESGGLPILQVMINYLKDRCLLLILDNCEHLIEACSHLADRLLHTCPQLTILASSRESLGLAGESPYHVPSLSLPDAELAPDMENLAKSEAVRLFVVRAAVVHPGFILSGSNASTVDQICRRLDGIPLAIELAAARAGLLSVEQIASRLNDRFLLLTGGSRTALPRQQTLRASIDWSYSLLEAKERLLLMRLSVFSGSCTLEACEVVCTFDPLVPMDILEAITSLVKKSLVVVEPHETGDSRYRLLETIRQYARERLLDQDFSNSGQATSPGWSQLRQRHLDYFRQLAIQAKTKLTGRDQLRWFRRIDIELDNIRAALEWALNTDLISFLALTNSLGYYWLASGMVKEGSEWLQRGLAHKELSIVHIFDQSIALGNLGLCQFALNNFSESCLFLQKSVDILRKQDYPAELAYFLSWLAISHASSGLSHAIPLAEEAVALARTCSEADILATALLHLGICQPNDQWQAALRYTEECASLFDKHGNRLRYASALRHLGNIYGKNGDFELGRSYLQKAILVDQEFSVKWYLMYDMLFLGEVACMAGQYDLAEASFQECLTISQEIGNQAMAAWALKNLGLVSRCQGNPDQATLYLLKSSEITGVVANFNDRIITLSIIAGLALDQGHAEQAVRLQSVVNNKGPQILNENFLAHYQRDLETARLALDVGTFQSAWEAGKQMTLDQAEQMAFAEKRHLIG